MERPVHYLLLPACVNGGLHYSRSFSNTLCKLLDVYQDCDYRLENAAGNISFDFSASFQGA